MTKLPPNARLVASVPLERLDRTQGDGSLPQIGDLVWVDHAYTNDDGVTMYIVFCDRPDGQCKWLADLYEHELEPLKG